MQKIKVGTVLLILAIAAVCFSVVEAFPHKSGETEGKAQLSLLEDGWYTLRGGERVPVTLPASMDGIEGEETLTLYNDSLTPEDAGMTLTTRSACYEIEVLMNGKTLYRYNDTHFPRNDQMKSKYDCDILLPVNEPMGVLQVVYHKEEAGAYALSPFYIGNGSAVMWHHLMDAALTIGIAFLFILLAVIATGVSVYLRFSRLDYQRFFDTAVFLSICSLWFITDTSLVQIQSGNAAAVCTVSFYAFMLLATPMLYFIKHTAGLKKYRTLDVLLCAFYLNATLQGLLHLTLHVEFRQMLFVTHLLLFAGVSASSVLLVKEYLKNRTRDVGMVLAAFVILGFSGVLSMALYWILEIPYYGAIFEIGICLFVMIIIASIVISMAENMHYRTEMQVYRRMLREDWMTGMPNRLPFEDYLSEIQKAPAQYRDAALVFLKVNQLKMTNDESGHAAGDKLILGAAKCISETFAKAGRCYRLEGDEFCVILENPQTGQEEWFRRLDAEIRKYNRSSPYWLSISRGWSNFCSENGCFRTISDWKYDANSKLYQNRDKRELP